MNSKRIYSQKEHVSVRIGDCVAENFLISFYVEYNIY